jgi:hypothetical protein
MNELNDIKFRKDDPRVISTDGELVTEAELKEEA